VLRRRRERHEQNQMPKGSEAHAGCLIARDTMVRPVFGWGRKARGPARQSKIRAQEEGTRDSVRQPAARKDTRSRGSGSRLSPGTF
jgi:hypothetical protein